MKPVEPVITGLPNIRLGEGQEQYLVLPAIALADAERSLLTRWELSDEDRARIAVGGSIYLTVMTFGLPLQPVFLQTEPPQLEVLTEEGFRIVRGE